MDVCGARFVDIIELEMSFSELTLLPKKNWFHSFLLLQVCGVCWNMQVGGVCW